MKKHILTLFLLLAAFCGTQAQPLKVDWHISELGTTSGGYTVKTGVTYTVKSSCTNFCASSSFAWTAYPVKGCSISSATIEEPSLSFTKPGTYTVKLSVKTVTAPGWQCMTDQKDKYYVFYVK
jgi:hypothetical protein